MFWKELFTHSVYYACLAWMFVIFECVSFAFGFVRFYCISS